jgi:hypothetical protein
LLCESPRPIGGILPEILLKSSSRGGRPKLNSLINGFPA